MSLGKTLALTASLIAGSLAAPPATNESHAGQLSSVSPALEQACKPTVQRRTHQTPVRTSHARWPDDGRACARRLPQ